MEANQDNDDAGSIMEANQDNDDAESIMEANQDNDDGAPLPPEVKLPRPRRIIQKKPTAASEAEAEAEVKSYPCKGCDKSFSSVKALGGHISTAHVQAKKGYCFKKMSSSDASSSSASPTFACSECDKVFPTDKSLCGHMRWHPERQWRGMKPPQQHSMAEDGSVDDLINCSGHKLGFGVNGWPTSKRGRPATTASGSGSDKEKGTKSKSKFTGFEALKIQKSDEKPGGGAKGKEKIQNQNQNSKTLILGGGVETDSVDEQLMMAIEVLLRWKIETEAPETSSSSSSKKLDSNLGPDFFSPTHHSDCDSESEGEMPIKKKKKEKLVMVTAGATGNEAKGDDGEMESSSAEKAEAVPFAFDLNKAPPMEEDD